MKLSSVLVCVLPLCLFGCGGGSGGSSTTTNNPGPGSGSQTPVAIMSNMTFSPTNATAAAGTVVQWTNTDSINHTVTSDTGTPGMSSDTQFPNGLPGGAVFDWTIPAGAASGTKYYYHCRFHGAAGNGSSLGAGMAGVITVQ